MYRLDLVFPSSYDPKRIIQAIQVEALPDIHITNRKIAQNENITLLDADIVVIVFETLNQLPNRNSLSECAQLSIPIIFISPNIYKYLHSIEVYEPIAIFSEPIDLISLCFHIKRILTTPYESKDKEFWSDPLTNSLFLKYQSKFIRIPYKDLLFLEADGNYITVQTKEQRYVVRISLRKSEGVLRSHSYMQIHRNYIVNYHLIKEVDIENNMVKIGPYKLPIGRSYKSQLKETLNALQ